MTGVAIVDLFPPLLPRMTLTRKQWLQLSPMATKLLLSTLLSLPLRSLNMSRGKVQIRNLWSLSFNGVIASPILFPLFRSPIVLALLLNKLPLPPLKIISRQVLLKAPRAKGMKPRKANVPAALLPRSELPRANIPLLREIPYIVYREVAGHAILTAPAATLPQTIGIAMVVPLLLEEKAMAQPVLPVTVHPVSMFRPLPKEVLFMVGPPGAFIRKLFLNLI